jgi:SAGA-associated factor 29
MTQVWHSLVDTIRQLPRPAEPTSEDLLSAQKEKSTLDTAIDQLSLLIKMRRGDSVPAESLPAIITSAATPTPSVPSVSTPLSSATTNLKRKRDRERDRDRDRRPSLSASPAPQPVTASTESAMTSIPSPMPLLPRGGTPMSREATGKARKEQYYDQLPLQPGRKVAFKVPNKGKDKAEDETGEEAWILATIRKCINQDKMRNEVQDADDANTSVAAVLFEFDFPSHFTVARRPPSHHLFHPISSRLSKPRFRRGHDTASPPPFSLSLHSLSHPHQQPLTSHTL